MMLKFLRKRANGWFIKVLLVLLALTFVLWGIGDVLRNKNKILAFKVGDNEVTAAEWNNAYNKQIAQIETQIGKKLTEEEASLMGVNKVILNQLINKELLKLEAENLGLLVSDDMVKFEISTLPTFQKDGKFSKEVFTQILQASRLSERELMEVIRESISNEIIVTLLNINRSVPKSYIDTLTKALGETRVVEVYSVSQNDIKVGVPQIDELKDTYNLNIENFYIPEKRGVNVAIFDISNVGSVPSVTDEEIQEYYENNKLIYTIPNSRKVHQLVFKNKDQAEEAHALLVSGKSFAEVGKKFFPNQKSFLLGDNVNESSFDGEIKSGIFDTEVGKFSGVIKSAFGFHIFKIESATNGRTKNLNEVKSKISKQIADEKKFEALSSLTQDVEKDINYGSSLGQLAEKYNFKIKSFNNLTQEDLTKNAKEIGGDRLASAVFTSEVNITSSVIPYENNKFFVYEVVKITPKKARSFEDVKGEVIKMWIKDRKMDLAYKISGESVAALRAGAEKAEVLKKNNTKLLNSKLELNRLKVQNNLSPKMVHYVFNLSKNAYTDPVNDGKGNYQFAKLIVIKPMTEAEIVKNNKLIQNSITESIGEEMVNQYLSYLRKKYYIKVYDDVVKLD